MAKEKGSLLACMRKTEHHLSLANLRPMFLGGASLEDFEYRFKIMRDEINNAMVQVKKIQAIAEEKGYSKILDILNEPIEFGHDFDALFKEANIQ